MRTSLLAWLTLILSLGLWSVFGFLVWSLYGERVEYISAAAAAQEAGLRGESVSRLRATIEDTKDARASLDALIALDILRAVEILEQAARQAGASEVSIGEANASSLGSKVPKDLSAVSIVVNIEGSFSSLVRAMSLYETLTVPSTLEQFEMEKVGSAWRATARVRVYLLQK